MEGWAWRGTARTYPNAACHMEGVAHAHKGCGGPGHTGLGCTEKGYAEQGGLGKGVLSWGMQVEELGLVRWRSWGIVVSCDVAAKSTTVMRVRCRTL